MTARKQVNVRLPLALQAELARASKAAKRTFNAELVIRLESSVASQGGHAAPQAHLPLASSAQAVPDQYEAAARIFASCLQTAQCMGASVPRARSFAGMQAKRLTGVDWAAELKTAAITGRPPAEVSSSVSDFLGEWQSGALGLPWAPALSIDVHDAFVTWARMQGHAPLAMRTFVLAAVRSRLVKSRRGSWRECRKVRSPSAFLVPMDTDKPADQHLADWLGEAVSAFRKAMKQGRRA